MTKEQNSTSEFQIAMNSFKRNRLAVVCVVVLCLLYGGAIFADFLSPYSYKNEDRDYSYCPPTPVKIFEQGRFVWPHVNGTKLTFDEYHKRVYETNETLRYPIQFFIKGDEYKLLGFIPMKTHLFGIGEQGRIYLFGADARGRDLFSRILYGGRVSLSIGLIGVTISFTIGLILARLAHPINERIIIIEK